MLSIGGWSLRFSSAVNGGGPRMRGGRKSPRGEHVSLARDAPPERVMKSSGLEAIWRYPGPKSSWLACLISTCNTNFIFNA